MPPFKWVLPVVAGVLRTGTLDSRTGYAHPDTCSYISKSIDDDFANIVGKLSPNPLQ